MDIVLTPRDLGLLLDCYEQVQLSFAQIHQRHFLGRSRPTVTNRLSQLRRSGYLKSQRVGIVIHRGKAEDVSKVFQVTAKAIRSLQERYPQNSFRDAPPPLNSASLVHDLLLTDVLTVLAATWPGITARNGKLHRGAQHSERRRPDAVLLDHQGRVIAAVELELTLKSKRRYREIMLGYKMQRVFARIIYVVGSDALAKVIEQHIFGPRQLFSTPRTEPSKFLIVKLSEVLKGRDWAQNLQIVW